MGHRPPPSAAAVRFTLLTSLIAVAVAALAAPAGATRSIQPSPVKPVTSKAVAAVTSKAVVPVTSKAVAAVTSKAVTPVASHAVTPGTATSSGSGSAGAAGSRFTSPASLVGAWSTWVPGGAVRHGVAGDPALQVQVASGPASGATLRILAGGSWSWHGLSGRWQPTGDASYPIVLRRALNGHDWKVGAASASVQQSQKAEIVLYDGFSSYMGKR
jgi:hypothetical protein